MRISNLVQKRIKVSIFNKEVNNLEQRRIEVSFYKNHFRTSGERGTKPFQISYEKGKEYHFESRLEEKRSHRVIKNFKPRTEEGQSINLSRIPNLWRKRKGILLQILIQKELSHKIIKNFRPRAGEDQSIDS